MFIKFDDIYCSNTIDYSYDRGLSLPKKLIESLKYSSKPFEEDSIVYIEKDYVVYASLKVQKVVVKGGVEVEITDIRCKEYCNEPLTDREIQDLEKISEGIKYIQEKTKYTKECGETS